MFDWDVDGIDWGKVWWGYLRWSSADTDTKQMTRCQPVFFFFLASLLRSVGPGLAAAEAGRQLTLYATMQDAGADGDRVRERELVVSPYLSFLSLSSGNLLNRCFFNLLSCRPLRLASSGFEELCSVVAQIY